MRDWSEFVRMFYAPIHMPVHKYIMYCSPLAKELASRFVRGNPLHLRWLQLKFSIPVERLEFQHADVMAPWLIQEDLRMHVQLAEGVAKSWLHWRIANERLVGVEPFLRALECDEPYAVEVFSDWLEERERSDLAGILRLGNCNMPMTAVIAPQRPFRRDVMWAPERRSVDIVLCHLFAFMDI